MITPARPVRDHTPFVVRVRTSSRCRPRRNPPTRPRPRLHHARGSATAPQPTGSRTASSRATTTRATRRPTTFRIDVPAGGKAFANGLPLGKWDAARAHDVRLRHERSDGHRAGADRRRRQLRRATSRYAHPRRLPSRRHRAQPDRDDRLGRSWRCSPRTWTGWRTASGGYPFDAYGSLVVDAELGFALETQTLSLYDKLWFTPRTPRTRGTRRWSTSSRTRGSNSVSPYEWSDLWVNEGHASWYEFVYAEENGFLEGDTENYPDPTGYATLAELMKAVYAHGYEWRAENGPVARPFVSDANGLFHLNAYHGGALVLYALRQKIGVKAFDRVERAWVEPLPQRRRLHRRLHRARGEGLRPPRRRACSCATGCTGPTTPPMSGHPDWTTNAPGNGRRRRRRPVRGRRALSLQDGMGMACSAARLTPSQAFQVSIRRWASSIAMSKTALPSTSRSGGSSESTSVEQRLGGQRRVAVDRAFGPRALQLRP